MVMRRSVLVLGDHTDPHTRSVVGKLSSSGHSAVVLDLWEGLPFVSISYSDQKQFLKINKALVEINSVWVRTKPRAYSATFDAEAFAVRERREAIWGIIQLFVPKDQRLNDPWVQDFARNKVYQLSLARSLGMNVPKTIISSDALNIISELKEKSIIYKALTWLSTIDGELLFTNEVRDDEIERNSRSIERAPGIFQERIEKKYEYRVTVVDEELFPVRIYSQEFEETQLDWRRNQAGLRYELCTLDEFCTSMLRKFMQSTQLRYAAFDLIETASGEFYFLEANPAGNWLWLEERLSIPISSAICSALICISSDLI